MEKNSAQFGPWKMVKDKKKLITRTSKMYKMHLFQTLLMFLISGVSNVSNVCSSILHEAVRSFGKFKNILENFGKF